MEGIIRRVDDLLGTVYLELVGGIAAEARYIECKGFDPTAYIDRLIEVDRVEVTSSTPGIKAFGVRLV